MAIHQSSSENTTRPLLFTARGFFNGKTCYANLHSGDCLSLIIIKSELAGTRDMDLEEEQWLLMEQDETQQNRMLTKKYKLKDYNKHIPESIKKPRTNIYVASQHNQILTFAWSKMKHNRTFL